MISTILSPKQVEKAATFFAQAKNIVIVTHMSPDGDAMGSSLGMKHYLQSISQRSGLTAQRSFSDSGLSARSAVINVIVPNSFPSFLAWMPGAEEDLVYESQAQEADALIDKADLIILTDFHEPKRIGSLGDKILATLNGTQHVLIVDHHLATIDVQATFAKAKDLVSFIDSHSPSASELVYRLIYQLSTSSLHHSAERFNSSLPQEAATCLYTGMMTDTGNFSFNSNYPEMYEIVGQLVAAGVNKDDIYNKVFNQYSSDRMRLMGYCLYQKMRLFPEHHAALIYLSRKELYKFNFQSGDAEGLVNLPLQISDVYYSVFMREDKVNPSEINLANGSKIKVKISLRSQGDRPVNVFAHEVFGGGGHKNASGGEYYGPLSEAVQKFMDNYQSYFE